MRPISTILLLLAFMTQTAWAQKPIILCEKSSHNFGVIQEAHGVVTHTFTVKNMGKAPLVINKATASCGCTTPEYTRKPIAPGKTGTVKVTFNPARMKGTFNKTVYIYSNATRQPLTMQIKGEIR